jgi:hypothetical protein
MEEALTQDLHAGFAGQPLRQFVRQVAELILQVGGVEEQLDAFLGRGHYERNAALQPRYRNGYGHRK